MAHTVILKYIYLVVSLEVHFCCLENVNAVSFPFRFFCTKVHLLDTQHRLEYQMDANHQQQSNPVPEGLFLTEELHSDRTQSIARLPNGVKLVSSFGTSII